MRKWLAWILPCFLLLPFSAQAQANIILDSLKISLWSEYDQSAMLVIYDFKFPADAKLPVSVKMAFPKDANLTAVAKLSGTQLINTDFVGPAEENNEQVITLRIKDPTTYHMEFYEPLG